MKYLIPFFDINGIQWPCYRPIPLFWFDLVLEIVLFNVYCKQYTLETFTQACRNPGILDCIIPARLHFFIILVILKNCLQMYIICLQIWLKLSVNVAFKHSGVSASLHLLHIYNIALHPRMSGKLNCFESQTDLTLWYMWKCNT